MEIYNFSKPLYKYRSFETAIQILRSKSIYFSPPSKFNDPFDFSERLLEFNLKKDFVKRQLEKLPKIATLLGEDYEKVMSKDHTEYHIQSIRKMMIEQRDSVGVFSASSQFNHDLMWSHYADSHKGVCIVFDFPKTGALCAQFISKEEILPLHVNYVENFTSVPCVIEEKLLSMKTLAFWFATKSKVWEYEKEVRLIKHQSNGLVGISPEWISSIIFGVNTPLSHINTITEIVKSDYPKCKLFMMEFQENSFTLIPKRL